MAFRLANASILCNLDADNFLGKGFARFMLDEFSKQDNIFYTNDYSFNDTFGRVCVRIEDFILISGYNEALKSYGYEDNEFPYGKALWCNYPNNSLVWNRFRLPVYSDQYIRFHQQTMRIALELMEDDFAEETIFSTGLYLFTKALECIGRAEQKDTLSKILQQASADNSYDRGIIKKTLNEIDTIEVLEAFESYRNENTNEYSLELANWLDQVIEMLKIVNFNVVCHFICKVLGLTGVSHIIIVELLYKNYE